MQNEDLIRAYKNARELIKKNPENKDVIINEYIDLVEKINLYTSKSSSSASSTNNELSKLLKNPLEIAIYNNFQKFNDDNNDNDNNDNNNDNHRKNNSKEDSTKFLTSIYDLKYK
jgi:hypothetical protein